jgi:hypothetical protein
MLSRALAGTRTIFNIGFPPLFGMAAEISGFSETSGVKRISRPLVHPFDARLNTIDCFRALL